jgi:hypothetical protein
METPADESSVFVPPPGEKEVRLVDIEITSANVAFNVVISFLNIAQKRGAFKLEESAKLWECINYFVKQNSSTAP